jgi:hypothetical protein
MQVLAHLSRVASRMPKICSGGRRWFRAYRSGQGRRRYTCCRETIRSGPARTFPAGQTKNDIDMLAETLPALDRTDAKVARDSRGQRPEVNELFELHCRNVKDYVPA